MSMCILIAQARTNGYSFEKIWWRSWWSPLYEVLAWSCTGPSLDLAETLVKWSPKLSLHHLAHLPVRRSRSFWEDLVDILHHRRGTCVILCRSLWVELLLKYCLPSSGAGPWDLEVTLGVLGWLVQVLLRRSSGDTAWILPETTCVKILKMLCVLCRSSTEDLVEILVRSSLRGPCMKILQMPCLTGACMKTLLGGSWEVLVSRSCNLCVSSRSFCDDLLSISSSGILIRSSGMKILSYIWAPLHRPT